MSFAKNAKCADDFHIPAERLSPTKRFIHDDLVGANLFRHGERLTLTSSEDG